MNEEEEIEEILRKRRLEKEADKVQKKRYEKKMISLRYKVLVEKYCKLINRGIANIGDRLTKEELAEYPKELKEIGNRVNQMSLDKIKLELDKMENPHKYV